MAVSFLDLMPKPPSENVTISTREGPKEIEVTGVSLRALADIAKRFPAFVKLLDGGGGSILDSPEAISAVVAAALGHSGEAEWEKHVAAFPSADMIKAAMVVVRLTFPQRDVDPLLVDASGRDGDVTVPTSPLQLNN